MLNLGGPSAPLDDRLLARGITRSLARIREATGWSQRELVERLDISAEQYERVCAGNETLPVSAGLKLADALELSLEAVVYGKFDAIALARKFSGRRLALPERYARAAHSRRRTSVHLLRYCDHYLGPAATDHLLRGLQMNRLYFEAPDEFISIRFLIDACDALLKLGVTREQLVHVGLQSSRVNRHTPAAHVLSESRSVAEAYDIQINHLMEMYDRKCVYRTTRLSDDRCVIESRERSNVREEIGGLRVGSAATCMTRAGVASAIATFRGLPPAKVIETHCVHRGDDACLFEVDLREGSWLEKRARREPAFFPRA